MACQLNEPENGIAPTDSRLRPDQRLMEDGRWDEANAEKLRLEEKQRAARRAREHDAEKAAAQGINLLSPLIPLHREIAETFYLRPYLRLYSFSFYRIAVRNIRAALVQEEAGSVHGQPLLRV